MNLPQIEHKILKFWDSKKIFEKSIRQRRAQPFFSFYDGPPFASGLPHYGHILATTIKDAVLRFWTMKGFQVPRRVGWDCHGLPVENLIEKELGIKTKREIEKKGVAKFNKACRDSVFRYVKEWMIILKRVGRWADYKDAYSTMDKEYTESVWWLLKKLYDQGLVYQDFKVTPYCPRCGTPLSNFEVNQPGAYRDIEDQSIYLKFPIKGESGTFFLVWTTTPWTLPGNTALAVGEDISYAKVRVGQEKFILAKSRLGILGEKYEIEDELQGGALIGREYNSLYKMRPAKTGAYRVVSANFVSVGEGTGIVHIAPAFGEEDMKLGRHENLPMLITVDAEGKIKKGMGIPGEGEPVKAADKKIKADLKKRKLLFKEEKFTHSYPFCWRCDTPLIYYSINTWYVAVTKFKEQLVAGNKNINWVPEHLKEGRFGKWLEGARDWAISRNRFWGAPIPIWQCQGESGKGCGETKVVGSIEELKRLSGKRLIDLHRPFIDKVVFKCEKCGGIMRRTPELFDCWFESGSMPYAQWHYPFENKKLVEETFPADFIAEGIDQTRGWFYTLHVLATGLTLKDIGLGVAKPAYKNVIVNGLILSEDGKKLSKRLKNYTPPEVIFEKFGADTLRYFLLASTQIGEDYIVSDRRIEEIYRRIISTLWNSHVFFATYAEKNFKPAKNFKPKNLLDHWIVSRINHLAEEITKAMSNYQLTDGARPLDTFIEDLSNWYIRRSRRRFQKPKNQTEKNEATQTLYYALLNLAKLAAPFIPFITEEIYLSLKKPRMPESVHLCDYPQADRKLINKNLEERMAQARQIVALALAERAAAGIKVRQPLNKLIIKEQRLKGQRELLELIKEEINVKEIKFNETLKKEISLEKRITRELKEEGLIRELVRQIQDMRRQAGLTHRDKIQIKFETRSKKLQLLLRKWESFIAKETLSQEFYETKDSKPVLEKEVRLEGERARVAIKKT